MSWYHRCTILSISVVSVCLVLFTGCGGSSTGNGSGAITPTSKPATAPTLASTLSPVIAITAIPPGPAHKLGEEVKVGNLCVATLTAVKTSNGDAVTQPKSGDTIVLLDLTIKNTSSQVLLVSSAANFILQDSSGQRYMEAFVVSDVAPPDAQVQPGASLKGRLSYEIPLAQHQYSLIYIGDLTSSSNDTIVAWNVNV